MPDFTPLILHVKSDGDAVTILEEIAIVGQSGKPVTGLSNQEGHDEKPYAFAQGELDDNPSGLDTEGIVRTASGDFWLVDEYSPSIVHVDATGKACPTRSRASRWSHRPPSRLRTTTTSTSATSAPTAATSAAAAGRGGSRNGGRLDQPDGAAHTVIAAGKSDFDSGQISRDGSFRWMFAEPGRYDDECFYHQNTTGVVIVA